MRNPKAKKPNKIQILGGMPTEKENDKVKVKTK